MLCALAMPRVLAILSESEGRAHRQYHPEGGAPALRALHLDAAAVPRGHLACDGQAEAGRLAGLSGGEKRLEHERQMLPRDAAAAVRNGDRDPAGRLAARLDLDG